MKCGFYDTLPMKRMSYDTSKSLNSIVYLFKLCINENNIILTLCYIHYYILVSNLKLFFFVFANWFVHA